MLKSLKDTKFFLTFCLTLQWIPGHYSFNGNDLADDFTKVGATYDLSSHHTIPFLSSHILLTAIYPPQLKMYNLFFLLSNFYCSSEKLTLLHLLVETSLVYSAMDTAPFLAHT